MPPQFNHTWPTTFALGNTRSNGQRRESWAPTTTTAPLGSLWTPQSLMNATRFDPFASDVTGGSAGWAKAPPGLSTHRGPSTDLLSPHVKKREPLAIPEQDGASPEHISMMLRNLVITPSPGASPMPAPLILDGSHPSITPPALSPTTQIMSMGSNSSIHTPTPTRIADPLFTPTMTDQVSFNNPVQPTLFSNQVETPTKSRPRMSTASDEVIAHSRRSTGGASNLSQHQFMNIAPRHAALALQANGGTYDVPHSPATAHERVMSWMQRQNLSPTQSCPTLSTFPQGATGTSRQDWMLGSPQMASSNGLPAWDRPVTQAQSSLPGMSASMWAPRPNPTVPAPSTGFTGRDERKTAEPNLQEPINFLRLLQPSSQPPYALFVSRIVKNSDQQASIFLQQKLKAATAEQARRPIVDAIIEQGFDMMTNRFGNWAVQRCLEAPCTPNERSRVAEVMKGRVIELATNCYGTHVVQKALDCTEDIQLFVVSEMLQGDLAATLMNKHASHVWTKIMELTWSDPAPPIFDYVNKAMQGRWADLARHETGSLIVQHAFENLEESDKADCVREVLESIDTLATDQWGSWVVQHLLENGTDNDRSQAICALVEHIPSLSADPQGVKAIEKAIKSGGPQAVEKVTCRLSEPAKSGRRPLVVDLALGSAGSQLVSMLLPLLSKAQSTMLHDSVRGHIVTLKGSKSGSRVVWLFERMKNQHNN